jgi:predicted ATP-dependent endonuclease of OLD family
VKNKKNMDNIKIKSLGPIKEANINFGDLTLFVGPQASGKSILLQLIKLLSDKVQIQKTLEQYGYVWGTEIDKILDRFFGEGMAEIWRDETSIEFGNKTITKNSIISKRGRKEKDINEEETLFYIPAQRVICLQNGWPRFFTDYEDSVPYVLRYFSETLRQLLENGLINTKNDTIFPRPQRLKEPLRDSFNASIFHDGKIILDKTGKKRFKLDIGKSSIPFMAWSAGQKEFMPLLLSFYYLCPPSKATRKNSIKYVIIEEPEMGLHPQAIESVILQIIDLLSRDYKVIVSTHSPVLLEFAWAFNFLKKSNVGIDALFELFNINKKNNPSLSPLFKTLLEQKSLNTYYFDRTENSVSIKNISSLDAGSDDLAISDWGGLSSFASKASEIVSKSVANEE